MTKIAYAGFDLLSPALKTLLEEGCQLTELFTQYIVDMPLSL